MKTTLIGNVLKQVDEFIARESETIVPAEENGFTPLPVKKENFHEIGLFSENIPLVAVDGGNATIFCAPNFSVDFIRVAACFYTDHKKTKTVKKEFFCFVTSRITNGKQYFKYEVSGDQMVDIKDIESELNTLDGERYKLEPHMVPGILRRYAELKLAESIIKENGEKLNVVIDGSIKVKTQEEFSLVQSLLKTAEEKKSTLGFLSKTSTLLTQNAGSLTAVLNETGPKSSWYYAPVFRVTSKDYLGELYFVKLNAQSRHVFQLELGKSSANDAEKYLISLVKNANDPVFLGYPYSLIDIDKQARVSNKEVEYLKTIFLSKLKNKDKLRYLLASADAHDILDKLEY